MKDDNISLSDVETTEPMMIRYGYLQLAGEEIKKRITGRKTISGDYLYGRKYIVAFAQDGTMEGKNDIGSHHFGEWSVNMEDDTFTVKWDGWDNWSSRVYDVDGEIKFYDSTTLNWRTTLKKIDDGKIIL